MDNTETDGSFRGIKSFFLWEKLFICQLVCLHCVCVCVGNIAGMPWKVWRTPPGDRQLPHGKKHMSFSYRQEGVVPTHPGPLGMLTPFRVPVPLGPGLCNTHAHTHTHTLTVTSLCNGESVHPGQSRGVCLIQTTCFAICVQQLHAHKHFYSYNSPLMTKHDEETYSVNPLQVAVRQFCIERIDIFTLAW